MSPGNEHKCMLDLGHKGNCMARRPWSSVSNPGYLITWQRPRTMTEAHEEAA
jgi:hypothetical protein